MAHYLSLRPSLNPSRLTRLGLALALGLILTLALLGLMGTSLPTAHAALINDVDTTDDELTIDGDCSLREAIQAANTDTQIDQCTAGSGDDTILLPVGTFTLTLAGADEDGNLSGDLDIVAGQALTLTGAGPDQTFINAAGIDRVCDIRASGATVVISGMTILGGDAGEGGGISSRAAALTLINTAIISNAASREGGGLYVSAGEVSLRGVRILSNTASNGGALYLASDGILTAADGCFVNNADTGVYRGNGLLVARDNWWGAANGPSGVGSGGGDSVGPDVDFAPFKTVPPAGCTILRTDLVVHKAVGPEPAIAGEDIVYTLTITNGGPHVARRVVLSDVLPLSTTLRVVDQTDDDDDFLGFGGGTHRGTFWNDPRPTVSGDEWLMLSDPVLTPTGVFTARVIDAGNLGPWNSFEWTPRRPYGKALPGDRAAESSYAQGNVNMVGNRILLHLDDAGTGPSTASLINDTSGLGNHGACAGPSCPSGAVGRFGGALQFDGVNDAVTVVDSASPARYAIEMWVYPFSMADTSLILRTNVLTGTLGAFSHLLGISDGRFLHFVDDGSAHAITSTTVITPHTWYHVVGTAESGGDIKLFVNGVQEARLDGIGTLWTGGDRYVLGSAYGVVPDFFAGRLDEVAVYSRTLSSGEINDHYLRGALRLGLQARVCDDPVCAGEVFVGPGGLVTTTYSELGNATLGLPALSLTGLGEGRYFQYRATLETDQPAFSPQLRRVHIGPDHRMVYASRGSCAAPDPSTFACELGDLVAGDILTVTAHVAVNPSALGVITNSATVTSASPDGNPLSNRDLVTSTVVSEVALNVVKTDTRQGGTDPVNPGYPLTYTLELHNAGPSTAWDVVVTDTVPTTLTGVAVPSAWAVQIMSNTFTATTPSLVPDTWPEIIVTGMAPNTTTIISNTAWITALSSTVYTSSQISDTESTSVEPLADLLITKRVDPDPVDPGETLTYTIQVTNAGPSTASNLVVTETLQIAGLVGNPIEGDEWACGGAGAVVKCVLTEPLSPTYAVTLYITVTAPMSGLVGNYAVVGSDLTDPDLDDNIDFAYAAVRPVADLFMSKHDAPDPVDAGAPLTYTLTVTDTGYVVAGARQSQVTLNNRNNIHIPIGGRAAPYPSRLYLSSMEGTVREITVTLDGLHHTYPADLDVLLVGPGGQSVVLMANAGGGTDVDNVTLTFHDGAQPLPLSGAFTSTTVYRPTNYGLGGDGGDFFAPAPPGPYGGSLSVFNGTNPNGVWRLYVYDNVESDGGAFAGGWSLQLTARTTDTVTLTDTWDAGLSDVNVAAPPDWDCSIGGDKLTCNAESLAVGAPATFLITATAPITGGIITNTAAITSTTTDYGPHPNTATVTTTVTSAGDLSIVKRAGSDTVYAGTPLTYTLSISNAGPSPLATTVVVTDQLPAGVTGVVATGAGWTCSLADPTLVTCTTPGLPVGNATDVLVAATAPLTPGVIINTASVGTAALDPDEMNNTSSVAVDVTAPPIVIRYIYMPLLVRNYASAPDLVVEGLIATGSGVAVTILNQGTQSVVDEFWVDLYIDPDTVPTSVNQTWQHVGTQGIVWGVTADALPLAPGERLTLTVGAAYYVPDLSQVTWPLPVGTPVYAQVDSANRDTTYGAVLENHEIAGGVYNNISGPVFSTTGLHSDAVTAPGADGQASMPYRLGDLPRRQ